MTLGGKRKPHILPARSPGLATHRRTRIPFSSVNRRGSANHDPSMQRHHLLPKQLLGAKYFGKMFGAIGKDRLYFDDFRLNGLLLPSTEEATRRTGMPLHRGPHRRYNELVIERVGQIEQSWSQAHGKDTERALVDALQRLSVLQGALRTRLLSERNRMILNSKDPLGTGFDFAELDAMAEELWKAS